MAQCLHTRLKAEVSNPNLPVLETMQQFTLDAIAASGNSSMTDAQKWALNHFFYQIGAIDNSGIYAKLGGLYLPLICGGSLANALVDYKGNNDRDISEKNVKFQSNGLVKLDPSGSVSTANIILRNDYSGAVDNLSVAVMFTEELTASGTSLNTLGFKGQSADSASVIVAAKASSKDYIKLFSKRAVFGESVSYKGFVSTIVGTSHNALFVSGESFVSTGTEDSGETDPSGLSYVNAYWNNTTPIGIYAYGAAFSSDESTVMAKAMKELVEAFVS